MKLSSRHIFALAVAGCAIALANCGGGTVSVPAGHPGASPTAVVSASAHPSTSPSATASATATATATASAKPTTSPSAAPSTSANPSPSPSATPTTAPACGSPPSPDPNTTEVPILGTGPAQLVNVPCYGDFTGVATIPAGTTITGPSKAIISVTSDQNAFNIANDPAAGTRLLTTAISVTATITLGNMAIPTTVTSPSMINPGHIYEAELYLLVFGNMPAPQPKFFQKNLVPNGHTISFDVENPDGTVFPAGPTAYVVIYQNQ